MFHFVRFYLTLVKNKNRKRRHNNRELGKTLRTQSSACWLHQAGYIMNWCSGAETAVGESQHQNKKMHEMYLHFTITHALDIYFGRRSVTGRALRPSVDEGPLSSTFQGVSEREQSCYNVNTCSCFGRIHLYNLMKRSHANLRIVTS